MHKLSHIAVTRGHSELCDFASLYREHMESFTPRDVPQTHSEVDASWHQMALVIACILAVWVEEAIHLTRVTLKYLMRQRIWCNTNN